MIIHSLSKVRRSVATAAVLLLPTMVLPAIVAIPTPAGATSGFAFARIAGPTRYDTASTIAVNGFATAPTVVMATGQNFPDALTASYLAGVVGGPVLLTTTAAPVPQATLNALATLRTKNVYLLGGTDAIGDDVLTQLQNTPAAGGGNLAVTRIAGQTRYDTNQAGAEAGAQSGPAGTTEGTISNQRTAIVSSGANFPDALASGPLAWAKRFPIVLTDPNILSPQASQTMSDLGIQQVLIVGGTAAVSSAVEAQIHSQGIATVARFAGVDRSDTSRLMAEYAVATLGFSAASIDVATGDQRLGGADALAGGPYAGHQGGAAVPILITNSSTDAGADPAYANAHAATLQSGVAFGGGLALPDSTLNPIAVAAQGGHSNVTYIATSGASNAALSTGGTRGFGFGSIGATNVDIRLAACGDLQDNANTYTFTGTNPGGTGNQAAFPTPISAQITQINGVPFAPAPSAKNVTPQNGALSLQITDPTAECVVPVVFSHADNDDTLELAANGQPSEPFGVGGMTTFTPPAAPNGPFGTAGNAAPAISAVDTTLDYFVQSQGNPSAPATYQFSSSDTFQIYNTASHGCVADSFADFLARVSVGDAVSGNYQAAPAGQTSTPSASTFCLLDQAPLPPPVPPGVTATSSSFGVALSWTDSATPSVASYAVYRAAAQAAGGGGSSYTCPAAVSPSGSPLTGPPSPYVAVASVADKSAAGGPEGTYTYNDPNVVSGSFYCYAIASHDAGGQVGNGVLDVNTSPTAMSGPNAVQAQQVTGNPSVPVFVNGTASVSGSSVTVFYNEPISCTSIDADYSDYTASVTHNGTSSPETFKTTTPPGCADNGTNSSGTNGVGQVILSLVSAPAAGDSITVSAKVGNDGNTVADGSGHTQAIGNTVTSSGAA